MHLLPSVLSRKSKLKCKEQKELDRPAERRGGRAGMGSQPGSLQTHFLRREKTVPDFISTPELVV